MSDSGASEFQTLFVDAPTGDSVSIRTHAGIIKPILNPIGRLVDEAKWRFDAEGLHVQTVDSTNVGMLIFDVSPAAFEEYDLRSDDGLLVGMQIDKLKDYVRSARMSGSHQDPVALNLSRTATKVTIQRQYEHTHVRRRDEFLTADPDSIRDEPDSVDIALPWRATVDVDAFNDVVGDINQTADYVKLAESDGHLILSGTVTDSGDIMRATEADFGDIVEDNDSVGGENDGASALFPIDYMKDMAKGAKESKADQLTLEWGDEYPCRINFSRMIDETVAVDGTYLLAPRIRDEDQV